MTGFHPDLSKAKFAPKGLGLPRTLRLFRAADWLARRRGAGDRRVQITDTASVHVTNAPSGRSTAPALLWIHGGGMVLGSAAGEKQTMAEFAEQLDITVASVDYRVAPDDPFPAAIDDCAAALTWLAEQPGVDRNRIAIGGASAGGGLAAGLALKARDELDVQPVLQLLVYPMLDDRTVERADIDDEYVRIWSRTNNRFGWESYLGGPVGGADVSPYAAPARATDLTGLPPAWIGVGTVDLFHDEDVEYARRLREAGVDCELMVVDGAYHGFDKLEASAAVARDFNQSKIDALRRALS